MKLITLIILMFIIGNASAETRLSKLLKKTDFDGDTVIKLEDDGSIRFDAGGVFAMTLSASGSLGIGTLTPDPSSAIDIFSTTKGIMLPQLSSGQRDAIAGPTNGLLVYNTDTSSIDVVNSTTWFSIAPMPTTNLPTPFGIIRPFGGNTIPAGWLLCDGSTVDRTTYAGLYAVIGNNYGSGDGATTFHLPDLRGRFPRGTSHLSTADPDKTTRGICNAGGNGGNLTGSCQTDTYKRHSHNFRVGSLLQNQANGTTANGGANKNLATAARGNNETRPINVYFNFIIRAI